MKKEEIKIKRPGALTKKAKAAGVPLSKFETVKKTDSPLLKKEKIFAENAKKWKH
ncbi:MAG: hypothetical protein HQK96_15425 [Nitrospirae bacterium]|nr:hypothetical protein [Nitrospirota bacterium]